MGGGVGYVVLNILRFMCDIQLELTHRYLKKISCHLRGRFRISDLGVAVYT
jgi:hypothetical protein